MKEFR